MSQMTITGTFESDDVRRRLDQSEQPLYVALSSLLRAEIAQGRWAAGVQLPTIAELSQRYSVARVTIRQALGVLSSAGLIYAIQGKGTFVAEHLNPPKRIELDSSWQNFLTAFEGNAAETLETRNSCDLPETTRPDGKSLGDYRFMKRIHRSQADAYCVMEVYLANEYYKRAPKSFDKQMIIPILSRLAASKLQRMKQSMRITSADLFVAQCLDIPLNAPIGELRRTVTNRNDEIVYYGVGQYRGDLVTFNTTIDVPSA
jgi:GntR family transcriptional regulator